jgi:uncharacterized protein (TIGR00725 family)
MARRLRRASRRRQSCGARNAVRLGEPRRHDVATVHPSTHATSIAAERAVVICEPGEAKALRRPLIGVLGSGSVGRDTPDYALAVDLGRAIAESGALLVCGGRGGIMEAAARGAREGGGASIGVLPYPPGAGRANDYVDHAVYTGLGDARNFLTATLPDASVAMTGEAGTLSEIGLALKVGIPLVYLGAWKFLNDHGLPRTPYEENAAGAVARLYDALGVTPGQRLERPLRRPMMPDPADLVLDIERFVHLRSGYDGDPTAAPVADPTGADRA